MNPFLQKLIIRYVLKNKRKPSHKKEYTAFELAKGLRELRYIFLVFVRDIIFMALGVFSAAFGLESFLLPTKFIDGGITGISLLSSILSGLPLPIFLLVLNIPFVLLGFKVIGRQFAIKTIICIASLAIVTATIHFHVVTHDKLLVAIFGGFFLGTGVGLCVRGGSVLDGTEVIAIFLSRKLSTSVGDIVIIINIIIFSSAAYLLSVESALYSMITYLAASKTLDFAIEGIEEYTGVTIISVHHEKMRQMIIETMGRGVTVYTGKRGYGRHGHTQEVDIVYTVVTRLEVSKLKTEIEKIDPNAFVITNSVKETKGGMVKKRPLTH
jgi:uncharacterized membrane-anchored protein YitT (DUF2179 family)